MTALRWQELDREALGAVIADALVVLPLGATEQHGPHLPTGTDSLAVQAVGEAAVERAAEHAARPLLLAPLLPYGASHHHLPFGATLSLADDTLRGVVLDLIASAAGAGARRLLLLNGHGGNRATCGAAAQEASRRHEVSVAVASYWEGGGAAPPPDPVPGHAGAFETSLMLAVRGELVGRPPRRDPPALPAVEGAELHPAGVWRAIDGFTDDPSRASAEAGRHALEAAVGAVADLLVELAAMP